jgi:hypothetical protein
MLTSLPVDLLLELSNYTTLPYFVVIPTKDKWRHLRPGFVKPFTPVVRPSKPQIKLLWAYWNYQRYSAHKVVPAIENGLRYAPVLRRFLNDFRTVEELRMVTALLETRDSVVFAEVVQPAIVNCGDQLKFENNCNILLTQALLLGNKPAVQCVLETLEAHEDEVYMERYCSLRQAFQSYFYQRTTPITGDDLEYILQLSRFQMDPEMYDPESSLRADLTPLLYGTIHTELLTRALSQLTATEHSALMVESRFVREENLGYFQYILKAVPTLASDASMRILRPKLFKLLYAEVMDLSEQFFRQFFDMFYQPDMKLTAKLASEWSLKAGQHPWIHKIWSVPQHQRMLREMVRREGKDATRKEFVGALTSDWLGSSLATLMKELEVDTVSEDDEGSEDGEDGEDEENGGESDD